jgi:Tfp pilus assembly protein PilN
VQTINLLAPAGPRRRVKASPLTVGAVAIAVVVAGLAVWSYLLIAHVNQLRRDLATATQAAAQLRPIARHVHELTQDADRLRMRQALLQQILAPQVRASHILETIQSLIPRDVWLTSLTVGSDAAFEGYTLSYPSVASFMVELERSGSVRHVDLATSQRETVVDREVVKFRITGEIVAAPPVTSQNGVTP